MNGKVSHVYLRLSAGASHSKIEAAVSAIEQMLGTVAVEKDLRDSSVYCFALPEDIDRSAATRIISALVTEPYIDEAWQKDSTAPAGSAAPFKRVPF